MQQQTEIQKIASQLQLITQLQRSICKWKKAARKSKDRYLRLRELITTEEQYLADLKLIRDRIASPLKQSGVISVYEANQMFPNVDGMIHLSQQIHTDLSKIFESWDKRSTLIGPTMSKFSQFMLVYSDFFKNYNSTKCKLKILVESNEQVKSIEKDLSSEGRILTFHSLISKPFQRPFKYHQILKEYNKQTPLDHPDKRHLDKAIECYHEVNQRNNQAMVHKQKNQMLMKLDLIFKDIIGSDARYFISMSKATVYNRKVNCYLLSDLVLISRQEGEKQIEYIRVQLNQFSFVSALPDGLYLKNRLLICGSQKCIHLQFLESVQRDRFCTQLGGVIQEIFNNEDFKEEIRNSRRNTITSMLSATVEMEQQRISMMPTQSLPIIQLDKKSQSLRASDIRSANSQRLSMPLPCNTLARPPKIIVLGPIKRSYSSNVSKLYYLTKFQVPFPNDYHQILYIDQDKMNFLQKLTRTLYSKERDLFDAPGLVELDALIKSDDAKGLEYRTLYYTLFLNIVFRHPQTSKRLDIYAHKMGVIEPLWQYLKCPNFQCRCLNCNEAAILNTFEKYKMEMENRIREKQQTQMTFFCPVRTFSVQGAILTMPSSEIVLGMDKLFWAKSQRGSLEYRLVDNYPQIWNPLKEISFEISAEMLAMKYQKRIGRHDRVGQIKQAVARDLNVDLSEYQMSMEINTWSYLLGDDQILWDLLQNQQEPDKSLVGFFKNTFGARQDTNIRIALKRVWWVAHTPADLLYLQKLDLRMDIFMECLAKCSKQQEIQFSVKDLIYFYACYLLFKQEKEVTLAHLQALQPPKKWKLLNSTVKKDKLKTVAQKMDRVAQEVKRSKTGLTRQGVFEYMIKIFRDRGIWGIYIFEGRCNGIDAQIRLGFDLNRFAIRQAGKVTNLYECPLSEARQKIVVSGQQLRIIEEKEVKLIVVGTQFVQMMTLLQDYVHFATIYGSSWISK